MITEQTDGDYWLNVGTQFTEGTGTLIEKLDEHHIVRGTLTTITQENRP